MKITVKIISLVLTVLLLVTVIGGSVFSASAADTLTITVDSATCEPGEYVEVKLTMTNNPGVACIWLTPKLDKGISLVDAKGAMFSGFTADVSLLWDSSVNVTTNGTIATLKIKVGENTTPGEYKIDLAFRKACNEDLEDIEAKIVSGKITVIDPNAPETETTAETTDKATTEAVIVPESAETSEIETKTETEKEIRTEEEASKETQTEGEKVDRQEIVFTFGCASAVTPQLGVFALVICPALFLICKTKKQKSQS